MNPRYWLRRAFLGLALVLAIPFGVCAQSDDQIPAPVFQHDQARTLRTQEKTIRQREWERLETLAKRLENQKDLAGARLVREFQQSEPQGNGPIIFRSLPDFSLSNDPKASSLNVDARKIREEAANAYFQLAKEAHKAERYSLASFCLRAVRERMPDHAEAQRILGYVRDGKNWAKPYALQRRSEGWVDHDRYGWVPKDWIPKLEQGLLPAPGATNGNGSRTKVEKWLPADQADGLRSVDRPWVISTEHFEIRSNLPLNQAIQIIRQLEAMHDLFGCLMADLLGAKLPLIPRFNDTKAVPKPATAKHEVYYFANKPDFVAYLRDRFRVDVSQSLGIYLTARDLNRRGAKGASFFYKDDQAEIDDESTLYHEISHQLLNELGDRSKHQAGDSHFWIFEGLGTYFETLRRRPDGAIEIGGPVGERLLVARHRVIERKEWVSLSNLQAMNQNRYRDLNSVHMHYSESMALAVFFMQYQNGLYRDSFLDYAQAVNSGTFKSQRNHNLEARLRVPEASLEKQFLDYLTKEVPKAHFVSSNR